MNTSLPRAFRSIRTKISPSREVVDGDSGGRRPEVVGDLAGQRPIGPAGQEQERIRPDRFFHETTLWRGMPVESVTAV